MDFPAFSKALHQSHCALPLTVFITSKTITRIGKVVDAPQTSDFLPAGEYLPQTDLAPVLTSTLVTPWTGYWE
jgi:hypothetical protein